MLWRLKLESRRWRTYANFLVAENLWRAQRYGIGDSLIDALNAVVQTLITDTLAPPET